MQKESRMILPKAKEHLILPLKTSSRMSSQVNKLHKFSFFLEFSKKEIAADRAVSIFYTAVLRSNL